MTPFEFVLLLISFIYSLALTHLLMGAARMIRHRRELTFSWPLALWMATIAVITLLNWLIFWDFHRVKTLDLGAFAGAVVLATGNYFACALVTPEFDRPEDYDLQSFQRRQRLTYTGALLVLGITALGLNSVASFEGVTHWAEENGITLATLVPVAVALLVRNTRVQAVAALVEMTLNVWYAIEFYPTLS